MSATRRKEPKLGDWKYTVGEPPVQLDAYERADRGYAIYTRVYDGKKMVPPKRRLCGPIRDDNGRILPELENAARNGAQARQAAIAGGAFGKIAAQTGPLTLAAGFARVLHEKEGKYTKNAEQRSRVRRSSLVILRILDPALLWTELRQGHYRKLWRTLAEENAATGKHGARTAEMILADLQSAARWLQREELIDGAAVLVRGWKQQMKQDWEETTGVSVPEPATLRYSDEGIEKLWIALPKADPRIRLAVEIAAELRLGQSPRSRRSDVKPDGPYELGSVRVHGKGKKLGELVVLTKAQRRALHFALKWGHLADLEAARKRGEIKDFFLIPGNRLHTVTLRNGAKVLRARVESATSRWGRTGMRKAWRRFEKLAGVPHIDGMNWYGLRRRQTDRAEDVEKDARVLNRLGAWSSTKTREGYQEKGRSEIGRRAAGTREKIRPKPRKRAVSTDESTD